MDHETVRWADRETRRVTRGLAEPLAEHGFGEPWHTGRLTVFVSCRTCGAVLRMEDNLLERHWQRHHRVRTARLRATRWLARALTARTAKPVHSG